MKAKLLAMSALSAVTLIGSALPALADGHAAKSHWSGSLTLASDYRFRGISQTDRNPAVQGGLQYNGSQGIYAGVWASNVDFAPDVSTELDFYIGYTHALTENTSLTGQATYYWYLNADDASETNYWELMAKLEHQMGGIGLSLEAAYAPDQSSDAYSSAWAVTAGVEAALVDSLPVFSDGLSASGHFGHQDLEAGDYNFYDVGLTASAGMFALDVRYVGTDLDEADCGLTDWCEGGVVVSGTLSFGD